MRNRLGNLIGRLRQGASNLGNRLRGGLNRVFNRRAAPSRAGRSSGT